MANTNQNQEPKNSIKNVMYWKEYWDKVAEKQNAIVADKNNQNSRYEYEKLESTNK